MIERVDYIRVPVTDMDAANHFYGELLGLRRNPNSPDDDWVEYTVELRRQSREELRGFYSPSVPFQDKDAHELVLKRIGD